MMVCLLGQSLFCDAATASRSASIYFGEDFSQQGNRTNQVFVCPERGVVVSMIDHVDELKKFREHLGVTQETIAGYLGVTKSHVSQVERGEKNFSDSLESKFVQYVRSQHPSELFALPPQFSEKVWKKGDAIRVDWIRSLLKALNARQKYGLQPTQEQQLIDFLLQRIRPPDALAIEEAIQWIQRPFSAAALSERAEKSREEAIQETDRILRDMGLFNSNETCAGYSVRDPNALVCFGDAASFYDRQVEFLDSILPGTEAFVLTDRPFLHATASFRERFALQTTEGTLALHRYLRRLTDVGMKQPPTQTPLLHFFMNPMRSIEMVFWYAHLESKDPMTESIATQTEFSGTLNALPSLRFSPLPARWLNITGWRMSLFLLNTPKFPHTLLFGHSPRTSKTFENGTQLSSPSLYKDICDVLHKHKKHLQDTLDSDLTLHGDHNKLILRKLDAAAKAQIDIQL